MVQEPRVEDPEMRKSELSLHDNKAGVLRLLQARQLGHNAVAMSTVRSHPLQKRTTEVIGQVLLKINTCDPTPLVSSKGPACFHQRMLFGMATLTSV